MADPYFEKILKSKEPKRIRALENYDPLEYARLCDELGVDPEDEDLYARGQLELAIEQEEIAELKNLAKKQKYINFYKEVCDRNIPVSDWDAWPETKSDLLAKYFPGRFGQCGSQNINKYTNKQVGKLFENLVKYSKKYNY